jgi:hypothetical protein
MVLKFIALDEDAAGPSEKHPKTQPVFAELQKHIFINCPSTGMPVPTGLKTASVIFESLPPVAVPLSCPACGKTHKWKPAEAWIGPRPQT